MAKKQKEEQVQPDIFIPPNAYHIWTDGSYRPDGNAAFAYLIFSERRKEVIDMKRCACRGRTINQMELEAINHALDYPNSDHVIIYSDSMYAIMALTVWNKTWEKNNWITPMNEPVKNCELIQEIVAKLRTKKFSRFVKVKAHSGIPFNSAVDYLAQELTYKMREDPSLPDGYHSW